MPAIAAERERAWRLGRGQTDKGATRRDVEVALLAAEQHGVIATRQLKACGVDNDAIRVRVARGNLHPVFRGVYAAGHAALTQTALFAAAVLACGARAVLSHYAAAAHLGLMRWGGDRDPEVIVAGAGGRRIDGIKAHRSKLDGRDVWTRENIAVTSPARTILDIAATKPQKPLRRMVRQAQAEQHVNVRQLLEILHRHPCHPGAAKLRAVIADGAAPTRSEHEDNVLDLISEAGLERPEINPKLQLDGRDIRPDRARTARRRAGLRGAGRARRALGIRQPQLGLGVADDPPAALLAAAFDDGQAAVDRTHLPRHDELLLGQAHAAELHAQALQGLRPAAGFRVSARDLGHRVEAVQDPPRQPDLLRELLVDVDRVEVAGRPGVADREVPVGRDRERRDLVAGLHRAPRTMFDQRPEQTV